MARRRDPDLARELADVISEVWQITLGFRDATQLGLNEGKCVRFATSPLIVQCFALALGPPVVTAFRDLGVFQSLVPQNLVGIDARVESALERLERIAKLPLDAKRKEWACATSALAAGTFGAGVQHYTDAQLQEMRRGVCTAVLRTPYRVK